jgi:hypothetical protein
MYCRILKWIGPQTSRSAGAGEGLTLGIIVIAVATMSAPFLLYL